MKTRLTKEQAQKNNEQLVTIISLIIMGLWIFMIVGCKPLTSDEEVANIKYTKCIEEMAQLFNRLDYSTAENIEAWCYKQTLQRELK